MVTEIFKSVIDYNVGMDLIAFIWCIGTALVLGYIVSKVHTFETIYSKGFVMSLAILPSAVCVVILMVNGNVGTGVAVAGAFSLVRFRSLPGTAREISSIFLAMAVGLATGMGYIGYAVVFILVISPVNIFYAKSRFGEKNDQSAKRTLRITVPESLNYSTAFDEVLLEFTDSWTLVAVKTSNMGSMYRLTYSVILKRNEVEKALIDALRCRNGNLEITSSREEFLLAEL